MGGAWSGPQFVLTHNAPEDEEDAYVMIIGADVARQCIQAGLIGEIRVHLAPVLLGDGVRFFSWPGTQHAVRLETLDAARWGQLTNLHFRVVK
jgi:dihydrofolate reductase